tara:strand:- start:5 stop:181 length:177 start_codon:yes stop_codon:yes gene_type:complete
VIKYALLLLVLVGTAMADSTSMSLALPSSGMSYGTDSIKAGDLDCKNSIGGQLTLNLD